MPVNAVLDSVALSVTSGQEGDTITVTGGTVTSGATIEIYWDTAIGSGAQLLNTTTGDADGSYEVNFDVPEAVTGLHYIWAKDASGPDYASSAFDVYPVISISPDSGLEDDPITVTGYGFAGDDDVGVFFDSVPAYLQTEYDGIATWTTAESYTGGYSVKLEPGPDQTGPDYDAARVVVSVAPMTLSALTSLSYWWKANAASGLPYITIEMDTDSDGDADSWLIWNIGSGNDRTGSTTWEQWILGTTGPDSWHIADLVTPYFATGDWATLAATYTAADVLGIKVAIGLGSTALTAPVYIDDISVNGGSLGLEAPIVETTTDDVGSFETTFDVPTDVYNTYTVSATDTGSTMNYDEFILGASITLSEDEGPTGSVIAITGRGWTATQTVLFGSVKVVDGDIITVETDGTFEANVVIPGAGSLGDYTITATETLGAKGPSTEDFDITGLPEISVDPTYGAPGAVITVSGANFSQEAGTEVALELWGKLPDPVIWINDLGIAETDSDGTIEDSFVSPAVAFESYEVRAVDGIYGLSAEDAFKVGLIALIINPLSGEAGTEIAITGIGFEPGAYNLTFGAENYDPYGIVNPGEAISDNFYIPNVEPGVYQMVVIDEVENELTVHFTVTASTYASVDPAVAPIGYNISLSGYNFADWAGPVDFVIYNSTDEWPMDVRTTSLPGPTVLPTETNNDGNFSGWVLVESELNNGDYTINVTGDQGLLVQLPFSVVAARVDVAPRKALFDRGDTVSFLISNDFVLDDSYIEIYSPDESLWWITEPFGLGIWVVNQADLYTVPKYLQTANGNQMDLASDAPMGTWTYFFYDEFNDELMNGTFGVGASTAAQIDARMDDV